MRRLPRAVAVLFAVATLAAPYAVAGERPELPCLEPVIPCPEEPKPKPSPKPETQRDIASYRGLGMWVDAYDFSREYRGVTKPSSVNVMADAGVKTLYIQGAKDRNGGEKGVLSPDLLGEFLERAHGRKMKVVAWYLPRFMDPARDWAHVDAMIKFRSKGGHKFDSIGIDIESREQGDLKVRNDRLVALSTKLRQAAGSMSTSAIVVPPVVTDVINKQFWPDFPWTKIKPSYDVWIPMSYYTMRGKQPEWRDAYKFSSENVRLLRKNVANPNAVVHLAGGIGDQSTQKDYEGLVKAAHDTKCVGASNYDFPTTKNTAYATLRKSPS